MAHFQVHVSAWFSGTAGEHGLHPVEQRAELGAVRTRTGQGVRPSKLIEAWPATALNRSSNVPSMSHKRCGLTVGLRVRPGCGVRVAGVSELRW